MSFTESLFREVEPVLAAIQNHPFNRALADGSLEKRKFIHYMQQDSLYLIDYARALAYLAGRMRQEADIELFLSFSQGALIAERSLHAHYFKEFGVTPATEKGPACLSYTAYLVEKAATAPVAEAMAGILPCFWIYREVGNAVLACTTPGNAYAKWIETYSSPEFSEGVDKAVACTERLAAEAGNAEKDRMREAFMIASRLEYCFWDDAEACRYLPV